MLVGPSVDGGAAPSAASARADAGGVATIGLDDFAAAWRRAPRFAFALHAKPARAVGAAGAGRSFERPPYLASALLGVSVCLEPPTVYYLPLSAAGDGEEEEEGDDDAEAELAAAQAAEDQPLTAEDAERAAAADGRVMRRQRRRRRRRAGATPAGATQVGDGRRVVAAWRSSARRWGRPRR